VLTETTSDFAYCRTIVHAQLRFANDPQFANEDYSLGAPIALFTVLWVEGWTNHVVQQLFPDRWENGQSQKFFKGKYAGLPGKWKYVQEELNISASWPRELTELHKFRNRVCHGRQATREVQREVPSRQQRSHGFEDSFNSELGSISVVRRRVEATEGFLASAYRAMCERGNDHALHMQQIAKNRPDFDLDGVLDPCDSILAMQST
jgi:hypothetical protein